MMNVHRAFGILLALLLATVFVARGDDRPLTNADVVKMVQAGISPATVIDAIKSHHDDFDTSSDALVALKKSGVPDDVIRAMVDARQTASQNGATPNMPPNMPANLPPNVQSIMQSMGFGGSPGGTTPTKLPAVQLAGVDPATPLQPATAQTVQNEMQGMGGAGGGSGMLQGLASQGLAMAAGPVGALASGLFSMFNHPKPPTPHMHLVWALPNPASANVLQNPSPLFELNYADIPGIDPDVFQPSIVKLVPTKDNWRLVGASDEELTQQSMMGGTPPAKSVVEQRVPVTLVTLGRGHVKLSPEKPLDSGEYGIVLRPLNDADKTDVGGPVQTQLFYTVWDFGIRVPAAAASAAPVATPSP